MTWFWPSPWPPGSVIAGSSSSGCDDVVRTLYMQFAWVREFESLVLAPKVHETNGVCYFVLRNRSVWAIAR
jgi:hypothetical protein